MSVAAVVYRGPRQYLQGNRKLNSTAGSFLCGFWKRMLLAMAEQWWQIAVAFRKDMEILVSGF